MTKAINTSDAIAVSYENGFIEKRGAYALSDDVEFEIVEKLTGWPRTHLIRVDSFEERGFYMVDELTAEEIIDAHMTGWNGAEGSHLNQFTGFVAWAWDMMRETRTMLADGEYEQMAYDVAYSVSQGDDEVTEEQAAAWLAENREALIKALDAELADQ